MPVCYLSNASERKVLGGKAFWEPNLHIFLIWNLTDNGLSAGQEVEVKNIMGVISFVNYISQWR